MNANTESGTSASMNDEVFDLIERAVCVGGVESGFDLLAQKLREDKNYPLLFEVRVIEQRHKMGLPPLRVDGVDDIPSQHRDAYEEALAEAAREVGSLFLSDGDIPRAWPYFRAIGERELVCAAIEKLESAEDGVIQIALEERVHPRKGLELLLGRYGICRAITYFEQYADRDTREQCIILLVRTLHRELVESLQRAIAKRQGTALPHVPGVAELIAGREWLFGDLDYYVDTSHLVAVIRFALDLADPQALRLAIELCEYGKHLSTQFKYRADPPFEDVYVDHAAYLSALAGDNVDACIQHFLAKVRTSDLNSMPAQVLVALLTRLKRYQEAIDISLEYLSQTGGEQLVCPTIPQLCQLAGDYARLKQLARERGDLLSFMAATLPRPTVS
ncbi:MAG TPA: hypothetical protein VGP62_01925 [Bryobacteraceae bacterium]|nr:hypothetical protein [Bryobacteraceae bacterium]